MPDWCAIGDAEEDFFEGRAKVFGALVESFEDFIAL
jgi:hypothetical protein